MFRCQRQNEFTINRDSHFRHRKQRAIWLARELFQSTPDLSRIMNIHANRLDGVHRRSGSERLPQVLSLTRSVI